MSAFGLAVAGLALVSDQAFKLTMLFVVRIGEIPPIRLTPFFELVMAWNYGISYGLFEQTSAIGQWALVAFKVAAVVALWLWLAQARDRLLAASIALIIGGAIGNAIDRAAYGAVADFFHFFIESWSFHWYIFNIADVWIVAGVVGLLYDSIFHGHDEAAK
jgi:signal peptidase II